MHTCFQNAHMHLYLRAHKHKHTHVQTDWGDVVDTSGALQHVLLPVLERLHLFSDTLHSKRTRSITRDHILSEETTFCKKRTHSIREHIL